MYNPYEIFGAFAKKICKILAIIFAIYVCLSVYLQYCDSLCTYLHEV
jgi:hypothetical protein